jgi:hypothetical protein
MKWSVSKIWPVVHKADQIVLGWRYRLHLTLEDATGFDDFEIKLPPQAWMPLAEWTAADLNALFRRNIRTDRKIKRFMGLMRFRQECEIKEGFTFAQLKGAEHVNLAGPELPL